MTEHAEGQAVRVANAVVDGVDVDAVYDLVALCPGVVGVGSQLPGALATYLPGRRVLGVRVNPDSIELEVCTRWQASAAQVAATIGRRLAGLVGGRRIDVTIVDIELPERELR